MTKKISLIIGISFLLILSLQLFQPKQIRAFDSPSGFENVQIINNLADPDGFAFSADGRLPTY